MCSTSISPIPQEKPPPFRKSPPFFLRFWKEGGLFLKPRKFSDFGLFLLLETLWNASETSVFHWKTPILRAVFEKNRACGALISNSHHFQQSQAVWKRHSSDQFQCDSLSTLSAAFASWNRSQSAAGAKILKEKQQQQRFSLRKTANIRLKT